MSLFPYAVILQVTPIVAIAPLILIYVDNRMAGAADLRLDRRLLPDPVQHDAGAEVGRPQPARPVALYGATRWQTLRYLQLPSALPYFLGGLRIAGGLALIGAVVAEFVAGTGGHRLGPRLPHPRGGLPAEHPAHVRGAVLIALTAS